MFFETRNKGYDAGDGPVRYLDGSSLARPLDMPRSQLPIMAAFVAVAAVIGGVLLFNVLDSVAHSAERAQASIEENLARPASMASLPSLASLAGVDDEGVKAAFAEAGYTIFDRSSLEGEGDGTLDLIKLPDDVSEAQAALMYAGGLSKLSAADATLLLNGSWEFTKQPGDGVDVRVKYADFSSGSIPAAIQAAAAAQGFDTSTLGEPALDEAGNTYLESTVAVGDATYTWRISAIELSSVYDVSGLPETSVYVGIRLN